MTQSRQEQDKLMEQQRLGRDYYEDEFNAVESEDTDYIENDNETKETLA
jgi:hypothetical protein